MLRHHTVRLDAAADQCGLSRCRICGSNAIRKIDEVEFFINYAWPIYDCDNCGCRLTLHDASAYDLLYAEAASCYSRYPELASSMKAHFDRRDLKGLKAALSMSAKYRFIIEQVACEPSPARLLEIGCSCGHLTSCFILEGRPITGVDVSPRALAAAEQAFGRHFVLAGDASIRAEAPYDVIYHVGTIGCVAAPIAMTKELLGMLKPGGRLLFNAPNRDGCTVPDQLWFDSAPPPDLVTMFRPGFWQQNFGDVAVVKEQVAYESPQKSFLIGARKLAGWRWRKPLPISLGESERMSSPPPAYSDVLWRNFDRLARRVGWDGLYRLAPPHPAEFGLFVQMQKR